MARGKKNVWAKKLFEPFGPCQIQKRWYPGRWHMYTSWHIFLWCDFVATGTENSADTYCYIIYFLMHYFGTGKRQPLLEHLEARVGNGDTHLHTSDSKLYLQVHYISRNFKPETLRKVWNKRLRRPWQLMRPKLKATRRTCQA